MEELKETKVSTEAAKPEEKKATKKKGLKLKKLEKR